MLKYCANIYGLRLLIELLYITIVQGAAKLWHFKIGDLKKNQTFWVRGYILFSGARENTRASIGDSKRSKNSEL